MLVFDANEWRVGRGKVQVEASSRHQIEVCVSCTQDVQLLGLCEKAETPLKVGREFRVRAQTKGFDALVLKGKPNCEFGYRVRMIERQDGERVDRSDPPAPPMPSNNNLLLQIKNLVNQEMRRNSTPVLEPEDLPWADRYSVEDDDYRFEEDLFQSKQNPEPGDGQEGAPEAQTSQPPVPEGQPRGEEPPLDDPKLAAE